MKRTFILALSITSLVACIFIASCSKVNMATDLGQGLIPEVDNIHTFDTTLEVQTINKLFTAANDSFKTLGSDVQFLGLIKNDPIFGKTDARMYFQLLPASPKTTLQGAPDKRYIDSVVLSLDLGTSPIIYGDTTAAQTIQVSEISQSTDFNFFGTRDTSGGYFIRDNSWLTTAGVLGSGTVVPFKLKDSTIDVQGKDTVPIGNQLRIKLDNSFGQRLLSYDTTGVNDAFSSDTAFKSKVKGFALQSIAGGNALMAIKLISGNTKLSIYYRYENTTANKLDTAVAALNIQSAAANYVGRDYAGTQIISATSDDIADNILYIQNTPGSYANIKIPGLKGFPSGVIHMAELQMESIFDPQDSIFQPPPNMFLDIYDSSASKFKLMPYAFMPQSIPNAAGAASGYYSIGNTAPFYNIPSSTTSSRQYYYKTVNGQVVKTWRFNITGYLQKMTQGIVPVYSMRLYAPAYIEEPLGDANPVIPNNIQVSSVAGVVPGIGRVRIGGGTHPTQKMKLRIVYSKLQ